MTGSLNFLQSKFYSHESSRGRPRRKQWREKIFSEMFSFKLELNLSNGVQWTSEKLIRFSVDQIDATDNANHGNERSCAQLWKPWQRISIRPTKEKLGVLALKKLINLNNCYLRENIGEKACTKLKEKKIKVKLIWNRSLRKITRIFENEAKPKQWA